MEVSPPSSNSLNKRFSNHKELLFTNNASKTPMMVIASQRVPSVAPSWTSQACSSKIIWISTSSQYCSQHSQLILSRQPISMSRLLFKEELLASNHSTHNSILPRAITKQNKFRRFRRVAWSKIQPITRLMTCLSHSISLSTQIDCRINH